MRSTGAMASAALATDDEIALVPPTTTMRSGSRRRSSSATTRGRLREAVSSRPPPAAAATGPATIASGKFSPATRYTTSGVSGPGKVARLAATEVAYRSAPLMRSVVAAAGETVDVTGCVEPSEVGTAGRSA